LDFQESFGTKIVSPTSTTQMMAMEYKTLGNESFSQKDYRKAIDYYTQGIELEKTDVLLSNRAQCYLFLEEFDLAIQDCLEAIRMGNKKAVLRCGTAQLHLGNLQAAREYFVTCNAIASVELVDDLHRKLDRYVALFESGEHKLALDELESAFFCLDSTLIGSGFEHSASSLNTNLLGKIPTQWQIYRCMCLLYLDVQEAAQASMVILRSKKESKNPLAMYIRAKTMFLLDSHSAADINTLLTTSLSFDPDNSTVRSFWRQLKKLDKAKQAGNDAFKLGDYPTALTAYSEVIQECEGGVLLAKVLSNRAIVYSKLGVHENVVDDCAKALEVLDRVYFPAGDVSPQDRQNPLYTKLLTRRADSLLKLEKFEEAIHDYESCVQIDGQNRGIAI
jgi:DnaJ family protein C protein 7